MKLFEKTLTSETKFEGRIIKVLRDTVELENGKTSAREVVCHNGGVCVAALTEQNEVLLPHIAACAPIPLSVQGSAAGAARRQTGKGRRPV